MPTFDVVSEVDKHELTNAIDQANRELATRFDFKGTDAKFELEGFVVTQVASLSLIHISTARTTASTSAASTRTAC